MLSNACVLVVWWCWAGVQPIDRGSQPTSMHYTGMLPGLLLLGVILGLPCYQCTSEARLLVVQQALGLSSCRLWGELGLVIMKRPLAGEAMLCPEVIDDVLLHRAERVVALQIHGSCSKPC